MIRRNWPSILAWLLAAFFLVGASANLFAGEATVEEYRGWGYPGWFHYVTGVLELSTAVLLTMPATRLAGSAVGGVVMVGAAGTLILHGELVHALLPLAILALLGLNGWMASKGPGTRT